VILDEVDALLRANKGGELLYNLSRFEMEPETGLSLILVSQRDVTPHMDEATRSTIKRTNTLVLEPYGLEAMEAIVNLRTKLAFLPGAVPPKVAELVADIASRKGDARLAIELLAAAGTNANDRGAEEVSAEDVRTAKASIHSELPEHKLRELPMHELYVLLAIARRLSRSQESYATTGEVLDTYALIAEEYEEAARGSTQFWQYLKNLEGYGFVDMRKSSKGHVGTTHLISLPDAPAAELEPWIKSLVEEKKAQ
jgi:archaeal cell division control protein 6